MGLTKKMYLEQMGEPTIDDAFKFMQRLDLVHRLWGALKVSQRVQLRDLINTLQRILPE